MWATGFPVGGDLGKGCDLAGRGTKQGRGKGEETWELPGRKQSVTAREDTNWESIEGS